MPKMIYICILLIYFKVISKKRGSLLPPLTLLPAGVLLCVRREKVQVQKYWRQGPRTVCLRIMFRIRICLSNSYVYALHYAYHLIILG